MNRWYWLSVLVALCACQPPADPLQGQSTDASLILTQCSQTQFPHRGNRKDFQCGQLAVPENPANPTGTHIQLNIVRLPALSQSPRPDPVFVLAGGPGQASTEIVSAVSPWMRLINRERDIIFVDQRGTGKSNPLDCGEGEAPNYSLSSAEQEQRQIELLKSCLQNYQANLQYYLTPFAADDINAVSEALGYQQYNIWGASYGTRLGLEILRRHGDRVRSAVLDSVAPLANSLPAHMLEDADRSLQLIIDLCNAQSQCQQHFPDLEQRLTQLIKDLNQSPTTITAIHPLKGEKFTVTLDGQAFAGLLRLGLYSRELGPTLPLIIDAAAKQNFAPFLTLLGMSEEVSGGISLGLQFTILCTEDIAQVRNPINTENSMLQLDNLSAMKTVCGFWPQGSLPENYYQPISSDVPVLLLSGELDPVTPPRWGDEAAQTLSRHKHIVVPGAHHGSSSLGCVPDIIDEFYHSVDPQALDTTCVNDIVALPPFVTVAGPAMLKNGSHVDSAVQSNAQ